LKTKIVDDFIENLKQPTKGLDVNAHANNVTSQLDYVVLLRKLLLCAETKDENMEPIEGASERCSSQYDMNDHYLDIKVDIESGKQLKNPCNDQELPNTVVEMKQGSKVLCKSPVAKQSLYPQWFSCGHEVRIFDSMRESLEFEVSHYDGDRLHYIGTAFVDITDMQTRSATSCSGWFKLVDKRLKENQTLTGQVKLVISVAPNQMQTVDTA
jgi:hypothetical protein